MAIQLQTVISSQRAGGGEFKVYQALQKRSSDCSNVFILHIVNRRDESYKRKNNYYFRDLILRLAAHCRPSHLSFKKRIDQPYFGDRTLSSV